jgi:hypothetical protein
MRPRRDAAKRGRFRRGRRELGLVVVGDAAGLTLNTGFTVRGMGLAAGSGIAAAETIHEALDAGDTSQERLTEYATELDRSFVGRDMDVRQDPGVSREPPDVRRLRATPRRHALRHLLPRHLTAPTGVSGTRLLQGSRRFHRCPARPVPGVRDLPRARESRITPFALSPWRLWRELPRGVTVPIRAARVLARTRIDQQTHSLRSSSSRPAARPAVRGRHTRGRRIRRARRVEPPPIRAYRAVGWGSSTTPATSPSSNGPVALPARTVRRR